MRVDIRSNYRVGLGVFSYGEQLTNSEPFPQSLRIVEMIMSIYESVNCSSSWSSTPSYKYEIYRHGGSLQYKTPAEGVVYYPPTEFVHPGSYRQVPFTSPTFKSQSHPKYITLIKYSTGAARGQSKRCTCKGHTSPLGSHLQ